MVEPDNMYKHNIGVEGRKIKEKNGELEQFHKINWKLWTKCIRKVVIENIKIKIDMRNTALHN